MTDERTLWEAAGPAFRERNPHLKPPEPVDVELTRAATTRTRARAEAVWTAQIMAHAARVGWTLAYHTHRSDRSPAGFPDLVLVRPPRLIFAELKTDSKASKLTDDQVRWLDGLAQLGLPVETYVWRPQHWPDVERILAADYDPCYDHDDPDDVDEREPTAWQPKERDA